MLGNTGCWEAQLRGKGEQLCWDVWPSWETTRTSQRLQPGLKPSALLVHGATVMYSNKWIKTNKAWAQALGQTVSVLLSNACTALAVGKGKAWSSNHSGCSFCYQVPHKLGTGSLAGLHARLYVQLLLVYGCLKCFLQVVIFTNSKFLFRIYAVLLQLSSKVK